MRLLKAVPAGGQPEQLFTAIAACAPVAGGLIGTMGAETGSMISHVVGLPSHVLDGWAATPLEQLHRMMAPLVSAKPGALISDRVAIKGRFREELALLGVMDSAGLGESAGYKIASRTTLYGRQEHGFLTLALEDGDVFTAAQREMFRLIHPNIEAALARMALPLVARGPVHLVIIEEDCLGYLCLSNTGAVVELNERAHELAHRYSGAARVAKGRGSLAGFAARVLKESSRRRTWSLTHESGTHLEIKVYRIRKEYHEVGQDLNLVMLTEVDPLSALEFARLTPRQREVARLLLTTGLGNKQLADKLQIHEGTARKHVENVYRRTGVQSRAELVELASRLR